MPKTATVRLFWTRSPSSDAVRQTVKIVNGGALSTVELDMVAQEVTVTVKASSSCSFSIDTFDDEGNVASSEVYAFTLGDLEKPQPATNLGHEVLSVQDDEPPVTPPAPSAAPKGKSDKH